MRRRWRRCAPSRRRCCSATCRPSGRSRSCPATTSSMRCSALPPCMSAFPMRRSRCPTRCCRRISASSKPSSTFSRPASCSPPTARRLRAPSPPRCRATSKSWSTANPPADRRATLFADLARHAAERRRRRRARQGRPRHDRQDPVHLGLDRPAERRHQHPAHAVRQPGDDPLRASPSSPTSRRCWSTGRRGTTPSAATTISVSCSTMAARSISTRASRCPAPSRRPCAICATIAPTIYLNVPKGFEMLLPYLRSDAALRERFFSRLKVHVLRRRERSRSTCATNCRSLRSPRPASASSFSPASARPKPRRPRSPAPGKRERTGNIGLPLPRRGAQARAARRQARGAAQGPNITPGYWRAPELTAAAFDEEGFYKIGDALKFADPDRSGEGLAVRRPPRRGFQARDRHLGQRRAAARRRSSPIARRWCATWCWPAPTATTSRRWCFPISMPAAALAPDLAPDAPPPRVLADAARARRIRAPARRRWPQPARGTSSRIVRAPSCSPSRRRSTSAR